MGIVLLLIFAYIFYKYTFKSIIVLMLFLMLSLVTLYITNPTEEQFRNYYSQQIDQEKTNTNWLEKIALEGLKLQGNSTIVRLDRHIFSLYKVNQLDEEIYYIGIFDHFIEMED